MALNFPINPTIGQVYTVGGESWKWDGHCWGVAASADTYAPVFIGQFPPPAPIAGDLWWNSTSGKLCIYYADVDGSQWVSATQVPDIIATVDPAQVTAAFLEELTPYANIAAAVAAGVNTGQLFKIDGGTTADAIRAVASYGGGSGVKGEKGTEGTKGQKGENGTAGTDGTKGEKGQQGTAGAAASKGQKGEVGVGTKGQKGQDGTTGSNGTDGTKGQKGQEGAGGGAGTKGQKGQTGSGTPAGSNAQIQFNDNGAFGASGNLTWSGTVLGASTVVAGNVASGLVQASTAFNPDADLGADLGSSSLRFANGHINALTAGSVSVTGNTTLGDASTDTVTFTGEIDSHYIPTTNAAYDLGDAEHKIRHLFLSDNSLKIGSGSSAAISVEVGASGADNLTVSSGIEVVGNITPTVANTVDLGTSALPFNEIYLDDGNSIHLGPTAVITCDTTTASLTLNTVLQMQANILPQANNSENLGSTALKWNNIYGNVLHGTTLSLTGTATLSLDDYANDTAAAAGGVGVGQLYRNGSVVQIRVS